MGHHRTLDGFMLAAVVRDDRDPPFDRLGPGLRDEARARFEELQAAERHIRRARVTAIADELRPALLPADAVGAETSARLRAILATEVPRAVGRRWLADGPPPRRGYVVPPGLRESLRESLRADQGSSWDE
jgi:hypothetical protein